MLVLTRKTGEEVIIDKDIHIIVLQARSGQVKLGFEAPKEHLILRKEKVDGSR